MKQRASMVYPPSAAARRGRSRCLLVAGLDVALSRRISAAREL